MQSSLRETMTIDERIEKIEKQNRRLKSYMVFFIIILLAFPLMGAKAGLNNGHFRQITVEKIAIVNGAGQELMLIGSQQDKTGIRILNKAGKRVLSIGATTDDRGSGILIADKEGRPRFGLGMDMGLPSFAMVDENGKKIMAMGGNKKGYGLVIMDEKEVERAGIGYDQGNAGIMLYDDKGQYVRGIIREANGNHYSSYIDDNGREIVVR